MKILVSGDKHLGLTTEGVSRYEEQEEILGACLDAIAEFEPDVYVDLGDLFDSPRPSPLAYQLANAYLIGVDYLCGAASFVLEGNHDKTSRGVSALEPFTEKTDLNRRFSGSTYPCIVQEPTIFAHDDSLLCFLPYLYEAESRSRGFDSAQDELESFSKLIRKAQTDGPIFVFAHLEAGDVSPIDSRERRTGLSVPAWAYELERVQRVYIGHIHSPGKDGKVTRVGSSIACDFAESFEQKGLLLIEV